MKNNKGHFINKPSDKEILNLIFQKSNIYLGEGNHFQGMIVNDYLENVKKNEPQNQRCKYVIMPEIIYEQPVAFAYPKDSLYQEKFNKQ